MIINFSTKQRCNGISLLSLLIGLAVGSIALSAILSMYKNTAQISVQQAQQSKQNSQQEAGILAAQMELQQAGFNIITTKKLAIFKQDTATTTNPDLIVIKDASLSTHSSTLSGKTTYYYTVIGGSSNDTSGYYDLLAADQNAVTPTQYENFAIFWRYNKKTDLSNGYDTDPNYECRGLIAQNIGLTLLTPINGSSTCSTAYEIAQVDNSFQWLATELIAENPPTNISGDISSIKTKAALAITSSNTAACWPFGITDPTSALIDAATQTTTTTVVKVPEITLLVNNSYSVFSGDITNSSGMMQSFTTCLPNFSSANTIIPIN